MNLFLSTFGEWLFRPATRSWWKRRQRWRQRHKYSHSIHDKIQPPIRAKLLMARSPAWKGANSQWMRTMHYLVLRCPQAHFGNHESSHEWVENIGHYLPRLLCWIEDHQEKRWQEDCFSVSLDETASTRQKLLRFVTSHTLVERPASEPVGLTLNVLSTLFRSTRTLKQKRQ